MRKTIPTYSLNNLSKQEEATRFFVLASRVDNAARDITVPFRSNYFGIGMCVAGRAVLSADQESYPVELGCLITLAPQTIRQFIYKSTDYKTLSFFFTHEFITSQNSLSIDSFEFFEPLARAVLPLTATQATVLQQLLSFIQSQYDRPHLYKAAVMRNCANLLLYEVTELYSTHQQANEPAPSRAQLLTAEFKKRVQQQCMTERRVAHYADELAVSRKHLSDSVKEATGKTPGIWIAEAVVLEAKVLLLNAALPVAGIAEQLGFADPSTFGKYFKHYAGSSPAAYRRGLQLRGQILHQPS